MHSSTHKSFGLLPNTSLLESSAADLGLESTFEVLETVESTQTLLLERPAATLPTGLVCVTHHQSAGRGRLDRTWQTQPGDGLMFSVALRPTDREVVPLLAGVASALAVRLHVPKAGLKWPNDIVIVDDDGIHKLGGLVASVHPGDSSVVVVGLGINFVFSGARPTAEAAALGDYLSQLPTREQLLIEILVELARLATMSRADIEAEYRELCLTIGQRVLVSTVDGQQVAGLARTASTDGLTVELETRQLKVFGSADIVHLRNS